MHVVFLTARRDAPYRYRCAHAADQLRTAGAVAEILDLGDPLAAARASVASIVVLFRLPWSSEVERVVEAARARGVPLVFDVDDLVFDPEAASLFPFRRDYDDAAWERSYGAQLRNLRRTFDACDYFVGSTPALAEHARALGKTAFHHPNVVPDEYLRSRAGARRSRGWLRAEPLVGYFSGSDTHDRDIASVEEPLARVLREVPRARLLVAGHLHLGPRSVLSAASDRILRLPFVGWRVLPWAFAACRVTIAPLSVVNAFTDGKSALKFFEPGAVGVPTVATPVAEMRRAIDGDGERGRLATADAEWAAYVCEMLDDRRSRDAGEAARDHVERAYSAEAVRGRLHEILAPIAVPAARNGTVVSAPKRAVAVAGAGQEVVDRGRDARDLSRILRLLAARRPPPPPTREAAAGWAEALASGVAPPDGVTMLSAAGPDAAGWRRVADLDEAAGDGNRGGEVRVTGNDPHWVSPELHLEAARARWLVIELAASCSTHRGPANAQVFWSSPERGFTEEASVSFPVATDGVTDVHVVELPRGRWPRTGSVERMRFDPLDRPGQVRVGSMFLVGDAPLPPPPAVQGRVSSNAPAPEARPVDVVVPVYNAREQTLRCIRSVLAHATGDFRVIVVDDASTDEELVCSLAELARRDERVEVVRHAKNQGFVRTANTGIERARGRDVLLLNSDTEVFPEFLDRLRACAVASPDTGIVCPLSNNATICSVPEFCVANEIPEGMTRADMAWLVAAVSHRRRPELFTAHGFCMYVRRELLDVIGAFDAERYGRGFGEENDFAERAKARGWRTRLADDVYVFHEGKASYGDEGRELEHEHAQVLEAQHPGYHAGVAHFIADNPLAPIHADIRRHLARRTHAPSPAALFLLHAPPHGPAMGGTEHVVADLVRALRLPRAVVAYPSAEGLEVVEALEGDLARAARYRFPLGGRPPRFALHDAPVAEILDHILTDFGVGWAHVHHTLYWPMRDVGPLFTRRRIPFLLSVHDHYGACPTSHLLDVGTDGSCAPCGPEGCLDPRRATRCIGHLADHLGEPVPGDAVGFVLAHRAAFGEFARASRGLVFPSRSGRDRVMDAVERAGVTLPRDAVRVIPHAWRPPAPPRPAVPRRPGPLRVALIGEIAYASKGAEDLLAIVARTHAGRADVAWHVFGPAERFGYADRLRATGATLVFHGAYARDALHGALVRADVDVALSMPIAHETFSLTLSETLGAGVAVIARPRGALEERLRGRPWALLADDVDAACAYVTSLAADARRVAELREAGVAAAAVPAIAYEAWVDAYAALHAACAADAVTQPRPTATGVRELESMRVPDEAEGRPEGVSVTRPRPALQSAWWYRRADAVKTWVPESVRAPVRRRLAGDGLRPLWSTRVDAKTRVVGGLRLTRRYFGTSLFEADGGEGYVLLELPRLRARDVNALRFNLWCSTSGYAYAKVYWRHDGDAAFSEAKSAVVPLEGRAAAWRDYVVRLGEGPHASAWRAGEVVTALRFDPLNQRGPVALGDLVLCGAEEPAARDGKQPWGLWSRNRVP